jgi:Chaperone of endosialidase
MSVRVFYDILNQKGTPAMYTDTFANRPAYGYQGRLFISTDSGQIFEDTGSAWTLVADAGVGGGTLSSVCLNGNTTATGIVITAGGLSSNSITNTSLTAGSVLFAGASGLESQSNATFFWDNTNKRLGIGNASPGAPLDIHGTGTQIQVNGTGANSSYIQFQNAGVSKWRIGNTYNAGANSFDIYNNGLTNTPFSINSSTNAITLSANVTTTGIQNVQNGLNLGYASGGATASYTNIYGSTNGVNFALANGTGGANFIFQTLAGYNYTFPATTGTLALTSNLSSYVPYTGATAPVNLGLYDLTALYLAVSQDGDSKGGYINFKQCSSVNSGSIGNTNIFALNSTQFGINYMQSSGLNKTAIFDSSSITTGNVRTFNFPDTSGTLALTSNITSAISGSTNNLAKFTSANVIGNSGVNDDGSTIIYSSSAKASLQLKAVNNTYYGQLAFTNGSNALYGGISYNNSGQYMQFETNTSEYMRLGSTGNLLIGSTIDNGLGVLQVTGAAAITTNGFFNAGTLRLGNDSNSGYNSIAFQGNTADGYNKIFAGNTTNDGLYIAAKTGQGIRFWVNGSTQALYINSSNTAYFTSSVGVNIAAPPTTLSVKGSPSVPTAATYNGIFGLETAGQTSFQMGINTNGNGTWFQTYNQPATGGGTFSIFLNPLGGNVAIGLQGTISYQLQLSTDSAAKPTTALWTIASDIRIKENINPYKLGLKELLQINPITYDYNGLGGFTKGKGGVGIIAQEIIEILPNSVNSIKNKLNETDEQETDILNFNGHELIYVLINSVKELNEKLVRNNIN